MHKSRSTVKVSIPWLPEDDAAAKGSVVKILKVANRFTQRVRGAAQWHMSRRSWLLLCLATTLGGLALLILLRAAVFIDEGLNQQALGEQYAVYIDGGSSGTRVRVFRYLPAKWPTYVTLVLPEPSSSVEPGLSAYAKEPGKAAGSLMPLLEFAYTHVPRELWERTPVRLLATAGLRLLSSEEQQAVLAACQHLLVSSRFRFEPAWAAVIDGEMEGLFGWAAVNYITGALQEASRHAHHSRKEVLDPSQLFTGLLEMGGASMQVTFLPPPTVKLPEKHGSHLHLPGVPTRLFTHSYLGLGMDSVLARAAEYTLQQQPQSPVVLDPCLPIGYVSEDGRHGNGSFAQCLAIIHRIMPEHNCSVLAESGTRASAGGPHAAAGRAAGAGAALGEGHADDMSAAHAPVGGGGCVLQGSYTPPLAGRFVAVENFAWTARALGLPENATLRQMRESGRRYCAKHYSSLHAEFSGHIPDQFLVRYCFGAAYILLLLHHGFGLGLDDGRLRWTNTVRERGDGLEVGLNWVLGAAVVDAMGSGRGADSDSGRGPTSGGLADAGSQHFWLWDEHGMAATGKGARGMLLLPLAALVALAVFLGLALLRAARGRKARMVALTPGAGAGPVAPFSSRGFGGSGEERSRLGGGGGNRAAGAVSTAWSSSSLDSDAAAVGRLGQASTVVRDASSLDPGLAPNQGLDAGSRVKTPSYSNLGHGGSAPHEGVKHGGVLKAATLFSTIRRNASFTSVVIGLEGGTTQ